MRALAALAMLAGCGNVERDPSDADADADTDSDADATCDPVCAHAAECGWPYPEECAADCSCLADRLLDAEAVDPYFGCIQELECDAGTPERDCGDAAAAVVGGVDQTYLDACETADCVDLPCSLYALFLDEAVGPLLDCFTDETDCGHIIGCSNDVIAALCASS